MSKYMATMKIPPIVGTLKEERLACLQEHSAAARERFRARVAAVGARITPTGPDTIFSIVIFEAAEWEAMKIPTDGISVMNIDDSDLTIEVKL
jgi:uncharacterized sporulation protein YeaH/YhbH (DUF444 family)